LTGTNSSEDKTVPGVVKYLS